MITVELNRHPVLFIPAKPPASFVLDSKRKQADCEMRDRDIRHNLVTPQFRRISAFSTRLSFLLRGFYQHTHPACDSPRPSIPHRPDSG
ncbi:hypothetical protein CPB84DRAFT_1767248 [Gymnopilus junonius]|uniref:Uncharacterized protein n=1 Tax=Gymnopilus junonius TaxID=109634 RepID=A0A9P5NT08_GYMJU|nr:hypothetical protein CPB84DRAFT_1767248 [Gymnopilus junonius]